MATEAQQYFEHLLQSYGSLKGDPSIRRSVAGKIEAFLDAERETVTFDPEPTIEVHEIASDAETYAPVDGEEDA
jgi:hypothetical protein